MEECTNCWLCLPQLLNHRLLPRVRLIPSCFFGRGDLRTESRAQQREEGEEKGGGEEGHCCHDGGEGRQVMPLWLQAGAAQVVQGGSCKERVKHLGLLSFWLRHLKKHALKGMVSPFPQNVKTQRHPVTWTGSRLRTERKKSTFAGSSGAWLHWRAMGRAGEKGQPGFLICSASCAQNSITALLRSAVRLAGAGLPQSRIAVPAKESSKLSGLQKKISSTSIFSGNPLWEEKGGEFCSLPRWVGVRM